MTTMRRLMQVVHQPLFEAGMVNIRQPFTYSYIGQNGQRVQQADMSIADSLNYEVSERDPPPNVLNWFMRNFLNYLQRTQPDQLPNDFGLRGSLMTVEDYIESEASDVAFGVNPDDPDYPSAEHYGSSLNDKRFDRDVLASLPEWQRDGYVYHPGSVSWWFEEGLQQVLDYLVAMDQEGTDISRISVPDAIRNSRRWHASAAARIEHDVEGTDIQTVRMFDSGWRMVKLLTPKALDREGALCAHCVGRGGYDKAVSNGTRMVFSLRDADNNPHVTLDVVKDGVASNLLQARGHENGPVPPELRPMVLQFIRESKFNIKADFSMLGLPRPTA